MTKHPLLIVVLAAGKGVRMRSALPKVLHAHRRPLDAGRTCWPPRARPVRRGSPLVVAPGMEAVRAEAEKAAPGIEIFEQATQAGTADAVLAARPALERHKGDVIVLFADTPLIEPDDAAPAGRARCDAGAQVAVLGFEPADPTGYGRLIVDARRARDGHPRAQATRARRSAGSACATPASWRSACRTSRACSARIGNANAKGEYYLTDAVAIAAARRAASRGRSCARRRRRWASTRASSWPPPRPCSSGARGARVDGGRARR